MLEIKIVVDIAIQVRSLLNQLHDRSPGEEF